MVCTRLPEGPARTNRQPSHRHLRLSMRQRREQERSSPQFQGGAHWLRRAIPGGAQTLDRPQLRSERPRTECTTLQTRNTRRSSAPASPPADFGGSDGFAADDVTAPWRFSVSSPASPRRQQALVRKRTVRSLRGAVVQGSGASRPRGKQSETRHPRAARDSRRATPRRRHCCPHPMPCLAAAAGTPASDPPRSFLAPTCLRASAAEATRGRPRQRGHCESCSAAAASHYQNQGAQRSR